MFLLTAQKLHLLFLISSVCALSSAKALVQFVIIENFILIEELGFILEDYYFYVSHLKSFCICITFFKHIIHLF